MGTIMAVAAVLEIHIDRNIVQIMNPNRWRFTAYFRVQLRFFCLLEIPGFAAFHFFQSSSLCIICLFNFCPNLYFSPLVLPLFYPLWCDTSLCFLLFLIMFFAPYFITDFGKLLQTEKFYTQ